MRSLTLWLSTLFAWAGITAFCAPVSDSRSSAFAMSGQNRHAEILEDVRAQSHALASSALTDATYSAAAKKMRSLTEELTAADVKLDGAFAADLQKLPRLLVEAKKGQFDSVLTRVHAERRALQDRLRRLQTALDGGQTEEVKNASIAVEAFLTRFAVPSRKRFDRDKLAWRTPAEIQRSKSTGSRPSLPRSALAFNELGATEDVQITPAVLQKAAELGNNPARIFHWVRDNVQCMPTYGSIQGSDFLLTSLRGNPTDIASLLIALLRASNIPARYVVARVEVPAAIATAWLGVDMPSAAVELLSQGGLAPQATASGGAIAAISFNHVWAEAYVDYFPSRGQVNRNATTWIGMDPSLRMATTTAPIPLATNVPFDATAFVNAAKAGASISPALGEVAGLNLQNASDALANYQLRVDQFVSALNPLPLVGDFLGKSTPQSIGSDGIPIGMVGKIVSSAVRYSELPPELRTRVEIRLYISEADRGSGTPAISYSSGMAAVAGKRVALSYTPEAPADQALIDAALENDQATLPIYLHRVVPSLTVDGGAPMTAPSLSPGQPGVLEVRVSAPWYTSTKDYPIVNGDLSVIVFNPAGIAPAFLEKRSASVTPSALSQLEGAAETLHMVGLEWWAEKNAFNNLVAAQIGVVANQLPSHAVVASPLSVSYAFGVPRTGSFGSRSLDGREDLIAATAKNGSALLRRRFMSTAGMLGSYLETAVFEHALLVKPGFGLSTATALVAAASQNVPIYSISSDNLNTVLGLISVTDDVRQDIVDAISAGLRVTAPQHEIDFGPIRGIGYLIEDPQTGAAAYLISGGLNGTKVPAMSSPSPIQEIPANAPVGLMLRPALREAGADVVVKNGMIVAIVVSGAGAAVNGNGDPENLAAILAAFSTAGMIGTAYKLRMSEASGSQSKTELRKYSSTTRATINWATRAIRQTNGGPVFMALPKDPSIQQRAGGAINCPPTSDQAALLKSAYRLDPVTGAATAYVDISIDLSIFKSQTRSGPPGVDPGVTEVLISDPLIKVGDHSYLFFGPWAAGAEGVALCW